MKKKCIVVLGVFLFYSCLFSLAGCSRVHVGTRSYTKVLSLPLETMREDASHLPYPFSKDFSLPR